MNTEKLICVLLFVLVYGFAAIWFVSYGLGDNGADAVSYTSTYWQLDGRDCLACNYYYNLEPVLICTKCGGKTIQRAYLCRYVPEEEAE